MIATTDPSEMTPEERRAELASIFAAGFQRLAHRPRPSVSAPQDEARDLPHSPHGTCAGFSRN